MNISNFFSLLILLSQSYSSEIKLYEYFKDLLTKKIQDNEFFKIDRVEPMTFYHIILGRDWIHIYKYENFTKIYEASENLGRRQSPQENRKIFSLFKKIFNDVTTDLIFFDHRFGLNLEFIKFLSDKCKLVKLGNETNDVSGIFISDKTLSALNISRSLNERKERVCLISSGALIHTCHRSDHIVFELSDSEMGKELIHEKIFFLYCRNPKDLNSEQLEYLKRYLNIPLYKKIKNRHPMLPNTHFLYEPEKRHKNFGYNKDKLIFFYMRDIWDMKSDSKKFTCYENPINSLVIYKIDSINLGINEFTFSTIENEAIRISEKDYDFLQNFCKLIDGKLFYTIEYIILMLKNDKIILKAIQNLLKKTNSGLYYIFIHSLYLCEVIDDEVLYDLHYKYSGLDFYIEKITNQLIKKEGSLFNHNYGSLLRLVLYFEIDFMWKKYLDSKKYECSFFKDTKELLRDSVLESDLASTFNNNILNVINLNGLIKIHDKEVEKILSKAIKKVKLSFGESIY